MTGSTGPVDLDRLAHDLVVAQRSGDRQAVPPPTNLTMVDARQVQRSVVRTLLGPTGSAAAYKVSGPLPGGGRVYGALPATAVLTSPAVVNTAALRAPLIEIELIFVLDRDFGGRTSPEQVVAGSRVAPGAEVADCRWDRWRVGADWPPPWMPTQAEMVADNGLAAFVVAGVPVPAATLAGAALRARVRRDGKPPFTTAPVVVRDAAEVVANLANDLAAEGTPLRAHQYVASGALGPARPARAGTVEADFDELGPVQVVFAAAEGGSRRPAGLDQATPTGEVDRWR